MHQQSRYPPRSSSPANSPQTNPSRTNNSRDPSGPSSRSRASSSGPDMSSPDVADTGSGPSRDSIKKLDQIVQNFYSKAAVLILQSRLINTTASAGSRRDPRRTNKWFQIETEEMDDFREDMRLWKTCGSFENRPPPMIIETYLDASCLSPSQSLVVVDEAGKTYDVLSALNQSDSSSDGSSSSSGSRKRNTEVVLERWKIELKYSQTPADTSDFGPTLPTIYKRAIVFFRSLFSMARLIAPWRVARNQSVGGHSALQVHCRFVYKEADGGAYDLLRQPLSPQHDGRDAVSDYVFGDLEVPVGRFRASVVSRNERLFRVEDTSATTGSRYTPYDESMFQPTLPQRTSTRRDSYTDLDTGSSRRYEKRPELPQQTYGSLSTFHGAGALGTSPLSALRAVRPAGSDASSPVSSEPASVGPDPPHSLPISGQSLSRPPLRGNDGVVRRTSVSFQPFKAGSLSGSPRLLDMDVPPSPSSFARQSAALQAARQRNSLTSGMAASLRGGPPGGVDVAGSASPKPTSRYSSSFTHRRGKSSYSGAGRADDDQGSSGKQSLSSSVQPGSGLLAEAAGASSGSVQTDDENISEFLKILDSKRTLQSFEPTSKTTEAATKRTVAQLSKFQMMRESNNALTESMTSSINLPPSSSRQLASVSMLGPASLSPSSSPSKPLSPHTPHTHTPNIPSKLSEAAIIEHHAHSQQEMAEISAADADSESATEGTTTRREGTTAIDIPLSPRVLHTVNRRSSSVAHQNRAILDEDERVPDLPFSGTRSISLGADGREPTRLTGLGLSRGSRGSGDSPLMPTADIRPPGPPRSSSMSTDPDEKNPSPALLVSGGASSGSPWKHRFTGTLGRGQPQQQQQQQSQQGSKQLQRTVAQQPSRESISGSAGGGVGVGAKYGGSGSRGAGDSLEADDEPFMFTMSEIERHGQGRASLDEARPGGEGSSGAVDSGEKIRGGRYEARGISRRGW